MSDRENPVAQGLRYGVVAVVAVLTVGVLGFALIGVLFGDGGGASLVLLLVIALASTPVFLRSRRRRRLERERLLADPRYAREVHRPR